MDITQNGSTIVVKGLVGTVKAADELHKKIAETVDANKNSTVTVDFVDSFVITSSLIGTLLGLIKRDNANIVVIARNEDLYALLEKLNLMNIFRVRRA